MKLLAGVKSSESTQMPQGLVVCLPSQCGKTEAEAPQTVLASKTNHTDKLKV